MAKYPQKQITGADLEYLLNLKESDIGKELVQDLLAHRNTIEDGKFKAIPPRFNVYDKVTIPVGRYCNNKAPIETHVGMLIFFKLLSERELNDILPLTNYINKKAIDAGTVGSMTKLMDNALLQDKITTKQYIKYLNKLQWFFSIANFMNSSMSLKSTIPLDSVEKEKKKLIKENQKEIDKGNTVVAAKIEKQLLDIAKNELKDDEGMDIYESGANASFKNNYKSMFVMKGPIKDNITGEYNIVTSNLSDGIKKSEYHSHADSLVYGAYSKGYDDALVKLL